MPTISHKDVTITRDENGNRRFETTRDNGSKGVIRTVDQRTEENKKG